MAPSASISFTQPVGRLKSWLGDSSDYRGWEDYLKAISRHPYTCHVCTNLDPDLAAAMDDGQEAWISIEPMYGPITVTATLAEIYEAASKGCPSCSVVRECALRLCDQELTCDCEVEVSMVYCAGFCLTVWLGLYAQRGQVFEVFTLEGQYSPWPTIANQILAANPRAEVCPYYGGPARLVTETATSPAAFERMAEWIARCDRDHPYCSSHCDRSLRVQPAAPLERPPKRLLHVATGDDIRLEEVHGARAPAYIALSYCWGQTKRLVCTSSNYAQLLNKVPHDLLPKTIRDAIKIVRSLGLSYLWVDALCIIQQDAEDWQRESENMASIYANAYLTVAATDSSDCDDGCFSERPQTLQHLQLNLAETSGATSTVYARRRRDHTVFDWADGAAFDRNSVGVTSYALRAEPPLFRRGWCFQERILSGRVLHLGAGELVWECLGMTNCECGTLDNWTWCSLLRERRHAAGVRPDVEHSCGKLDRAEKLAQQLKLQRGSTTTVSGVPDAVRYDATLQIVGYGCLPTDARIFQAEPAERWLDLVQQYSAKSLTVATDALPALSGLAKRWSAMDHSLGRYVAGLWETDILRCLLWKCTTNAFVDQPAEYLAPTWSWASLRRPVYFIPPRNMHVYHVSVLEVQCQPSGINTYGELRSGSIRLRGRLVAVTLEDISGKLFKDIGNAPQANLHKNEHKAKFLPDRVREPLELDGMQVYYLRYRTDVTDAATMLGFEHGLVLHECADRPRVFRRIGVVEMASPEWIEEIGRAAAPEENIIII